MGIIYRAQNAINDKSYIGQTRRKLSERRRSHECAAHTGSQLPFHRALRKWGQDGFVWTILDRIESLADLNSAERHYIELHTAQMPHGYNLTGGGEGKYRFATSDATRHKMSEKARGKIPNANTRAKLRKSISALWQDPEYRSRIIAALHKPHVTEKKRRALAGKPLTEQVKIKISLKLKGIKHSPERAKKAADARRGRVTPDAVREKISIAQKGRQFTVEHRLNISFAKKGKSLSLEHRLTLSRIRSGKKLRPRTAAHKMKMSAALKGKPWTAARRAAYLKHHLAKSEV